MLDTLLTESRNPASAAIDRLSTHDMLQVINDADQEVAASVAKEIPTIAKAVDAIADKLGQGGRLFYVGAGTSGRLGVLDASECPPTYNVPPELVQGLIAGGDSALRKSAEKAEDDPAQGQKDLEARGFSQLDVLVGIAASGRTPYVLGAIRYARSLGALSIGLSCTPESQVAKEADIAITPVPGPEVITGSTRMRAGTATKLVLNMLSTGVMIRLGYVYGNLMVNMQPTNVKLADRAKRMIRTLTGLSDEESGRLLEESGDVRIAVLMHRCGLGRDAAAERLRAARGSLRAALGEN